MGAAGIIFSDGKFGQIDELVRKRTEASIPFGGRYRLVDFALSNMVNADITQVAIIAKRNYQSLMDHIGSGKDWDLSRRNGGVVIFPPFGNYKSGNVYGNQLEALQGIIGFITKCPEENIILTECDSVNTIDYTDVLNQHEDTNADITLIYKELEPQEIHEEYLVVDTDEHGRVKKASMIKEINGVQKAVINAWVIKRKLLQTLLSEAASKGATSIEQEFIINNISSLRIFGYNYTGVFLANNSMEQYYANNMALLNEKVRKQVLEVCPIYTKVRDSAPTKYGKNAVVKNSFIADGCIIEGTVENSILFRGVKIGKDTVVRNCILMQDTMVLENVKLNAVVTDKNVTIRSHQELSGCAKLPYYVAKNMMI